MAKSLLHALILAASLIAGVEASSPSVASSKQVLAAQPGSGSPCETGNVQLVYGMAKPCFDQCQESCPAVDAAITVFLTGGGTSGALASVCGQSEDFRCFLEDNHIDKCSVFFAQASGFGIKLPTSMDELNATCNTSHLSDTLAQAAGHGMSPFVAAAPKGSEDGVAGGQDEEEPEEEEEAHAMVQKEDAGGRALASTAHDGMVDKPDREDEDQEEDEEDAGGRALASTAHDGVVDKPEREDEDHEEDEEAGEESFAAKGPDGVLEPPERDDEEQEDQNEEDAGGRALSSTGHDGVVDKGEREDKDHEEDEEAGEESLAANEDEEDAGGRALASTAHDGVVDKPEREDEDHEEDEEAGEESFAAKGPDGVLEPPERDDEDGEDGADEQEEESSAKALHGAEQATKVGPLLTSAVQAEAGACSSGTVKMIYDMAPQCFNQCMSSCTAVGNAVTAYLTRGGQPAAIRSICNDKSSFSCFVRPDHIGACGVFFGQAKRYGITLPANVDELDRHCSRRLRGADAATVAALP